MQEIWVQSLDQEDPLEKEMATHCNILAWEIPWTEEPDRPQSTVSQGVTTEWLAQLYKEFKDIVICVSLGVEPEPNPKAALLFLGCPFLVSASVLFPDWQRFKSALWNSEKVMEAGVYSLQETGGHGKVSVSRSPSGSFLVSWVEVGLLIKKSEVLQEKETAYTKTQKSAFGGEKGKTQSLQTTGPFWSFNNQGAGGKRGERKLELEGEAKPSPNSRSTCGETWSLSWGQVGTRKDSQQERGTMEWAFQAFGIRVEDG